MADLRAPSILSPSEGDTVDGLAATLSWDPVPNSTHRIQVAANDRFDAAIIDADAGSATSLTLYELLPRDGRRLHWRVGSVSGDDAVVWSDAAWFLASDVADRPAPSTRTAATKATAPSAPGETAPDPVPEDTPLYLHGTTGAREIAIAFAVLLLTVVLLVLVAF